MGGRVLVLLEILEIIVDFLTGPFRRRRRYRKPPPNPRQ